MKTPTPKQDICECGSHLKYHKEGVGCGNCTCKKFKPSNQSPERQRKKAINDMSAPSSSSGLDNLGIDEKDENAKTQTRDTSSSDDEILKECRLCNKRINKGKGRINHSGFCYTCNTAINNKNFKLIHLQKEKAISLTRDAEQKKIDQMMLEEAYKIMELKDNEFSSILKQKDDSFLEFLKKLQSRIHYCQIRDQILNDKIEQLIGIGTNLNVGQEQGESRYKPVSRSSVTKKKIASLEKTGGAK